MASGAAAVPAGFSLDHAGSRYLPELRAGAVAADRGASEGAVGYDSAAARHSAFSTATAPQASKGSTVNAASVSGASGATAGASLEASDLSQGDSDLFQGDSDLVQGANTSWNAAALLWADSGRRRVLMSAVSGESARQLWQLSYEPLDAALGLEGEAVLEAVPLPPPPPAEPRYDAYNMGNATAGNYWDDVAGATRRRALLARGSADNDEEEASQLAMALRTSSLPESAHLEDLPPMLQSVSPLGGPTVGNSSITLHGIGLGAMREVRYVPKGAWLAKEAVGLGIAMLPLCHADCPRSVEQVTEAQRGSDQAALIAC